MAQTLLGNFSCGQLNPVPTTSLANATIIVQTAGYNANSTTKTNAGASRGYWIKNSGLSTAGSILWVWCTELHDVADPGIPLEPGDAIVLSHSYKRIHNVMLYASASTGVIANFGVVAR